MRTAASRSSPRQATAQRGLRSTERAASLAPHQARGRPEADRRRLAADDLGRPDHRGHQDLADHRADRYGLAAAIPAQELHRVPARQPAALPVTAQQVALLATARVQPSEPTWSQAQEQPAVRLEPGAQPSAAVAQTAEQPVPLAAESALTSAVVQALPPVAEAVPDAQPEAALRQAAEASEQPSEPAEEEAVAALPSEARAAVLRPAEAAVQDVQPVAEQPAVAAVAAVQPSEPVVAEALPLEAAEAQVAQLAAEQAASAALAQPSAAASVAVPEDPCCRQVALAQR